MHKAEFLTTSRLYGHVNNCSGLSRYNLPGDNFGGAPAVEVSRRIVAEDGRHALRPGYVTDGGCIAGHILHCVLHCEFGICLENFRLGTLMISQQIRPDKFIIKPFKSVNQNKTFYR